jgi:hypothetical protein
MKWRYGDSWEKFPIEKGDLWKAGTGIVAVHDIFDELPEFVLSADLIFIDPPYSSGALRSFYTKAGICPYRKWDDFVSRLFECIKQIGPQICYIEIGNQFVNEFYARLPFEYKQRWSVVYCRKNPTHIIRGGKIGQIDYDFTGIDEMRCAEIIMQIENYGIAGDLCMGRGLVGVAAYKAGKKFVGTELNKRRLACLLGKIEKMGGDVYRM